MSRDDLYIILEVGRAASVNEIKRAFRKLARRYHPDINPGDSRAEERFKRITEAYEILSDPVKREFYDVNGFYTESVLEHQSESSWGFSFQGFDFSHRSQSPFGDFFGQLFARQAMRRDPEPGQDLEYQIAISFNDSIRGLKTSISVFRRRTCQSCSGSGRAAGSRDSGCGTCGGTGKTTRAKGHLQFAITCSDCGGSGRTGPAGQDCGGGGPGSRNEDRNLGVPPGRDTGVSNTNP